MIEQLEVDKAMAVAESKQQFHTLLEEKDTEIEKLRTASQNVTKEKEELEEKLEKLETTGTKMLLNIREL